MNVLLIFIWVYIAMIAHSFWESSVEGRDAWNKHKFGWTMKFGKYTFPRYHFYLYCVMYPFLLTIPFIIYGWDFKLFGIIISAYSSGMVIEDFMWYVVNPVVRLSELYTKFSDYYPWIRMNGKKIVPLGYVIGFIIAFLSWYFIWR